MLTVALTGGIGCGKTIVANLFSELGVPVIDTDIIARKLVEPGQPALQTLCEHFGEHILQPDGQLDRAKLAEITFHSEEKRHQLESILHPLIRQEMISQLHSLNAPYAIVVIPLLYETGQHRQIDRILVVDCSPEQQLDRVAKRDHRSVEQITSIMNAQATREQRLSIADDIIQNTGSLDELEQNVQALHKRYIELSET